MSAGLSHRFVPGEANISFTSVVELWSTRTGSSLLLTASKSKKPENPPAQIWFHSKTKIKRHQCLTEPCFGPPEGKQRMLGAGGSSWGSISWSVPRRLRGFSRWRESTDTRVSGTPPTASWTTTSRWSKRPQTSTLQTSSATPACRASRPASARDTTAGSPAGVSPAVSGTSRSTSITRRTGSGWK